MEKTISKLKKSVMMEYAEKTTTSSIATMEKILKKYAIDEPYSLYKLKENALCLLLENACWTIATAERGKCVTIAKYNDISDACKRMLSLLGGESKDALIQEYEKEIHRELDNN